MSPYGDYDTMLGTLTAQLRKGPYLLGERFTAADVLWGTALGWTTMFKLVPELPEIMTYVQRIGVAAGGGQGPGQGRRARRRAGAEGVSHPPHRTGARPLTSAPASGDIFRKNGTDSSEIIATPTKTG